jgi:cystathionine gamma-synthase
MNFLFHHDLGAPIPYDDHAVSVSLPTWKDVVGYEEGHKRVLDIMKSGYPRFKIHSSIEKLTENVNTRKLNESISTHLSNYVLPTEHVARRFQDFLNKVNYKNLWLITNTLVLIHF